MRRSWPAAGAALGVSLLLTAPLFVLVACGGSAIPVLTHEDVTEDVPLVPDTGGDAGGDVDVEEDTWVPCPCGPDDPCSAIDPSCPECWVDDDCRDPDVCTWDRCDPVAGVCVHEPIQGCCQSDEECDDGVPCTEDSCVGKVCEHVEVGGGCCNDADGCSDGVDLTFDLCVATECVFSLSANAESCGSDLECGVTNPCAQGTCTANACSYEPVDAPGCCLETADCADADVCSVDHCVAFRCVYTLPSTPQPRVDESFDDGALARWTLSGSSGPVEWHVTERRAQSEPMSLHLGDPESGGYGGHGPVAAMAAITDIVFPTVGAATLEFSTYLDLNGGDGGDLAWVEIASTGLDTVTVWSSSELDGTTDGAWMPVTLDLVAYAGRAVELRFWMTSDGEGAAEREGWYVDDVQVIYMCPQP